LAIQLQNRNNCQQAPTTSPGVGMGACHHGGSRFIAIDTPLCPRFMPRPRAFFRNTYLLHDIGAASPVAPDFSTTTAASDACEFRSPTSSRFDKVPALLRHRALCARVAPLHLRYSTHEAHSGSRPFSVKERTPMPFRNLTMDYPLAGRVMSAVYPPSCGASIGDAPRFMGVR
jgi:hypothetical protein